MNNKGATEMHSRNFISLTRNRTTSALAAAFIGGCAIIPAVCNAQIDPDNDRAFSAFTKLATIDRCATSCDTIARSTLASTGLLCTKFAAKSICRDATKKWKITIEHMQFKSSTNNKILLRATLSLSKPEYRKPDQLKSAYFSDWNHKIDSPPEHSFESEDSIQTEINKTNRTMVFGSSKPTNSINQAILAITTNRSP